MPDRAEAARLLGVSPTSDEATIRRAFRTWAALTHPDHGGDGRNFQALCDARDALLQPITAPPGSESVLRQPRQDRTSPSPRRAWREVIKRPAPLAGALLVIGLVASIAAVLVAGPAPLLAMPAALASAAWCVAVSRTILRGADHGHVIVTRSLAWAAATCGQLMVASLAGIALVEVLPLLALPFVAAIAAVNPGAGLWRARRVNVR